MTKEKFKARLKDSILESVKIAKNIVLDKVSDKVLINIYSRDKKNSYHQTFHINLPFFTTTTISTPTSQVPFLPLPYHIVMKTTYQQTSQLHAFQ